MKKLLFKLYDSVRNRFFHNAASRHLPENGDIKKIDEQIVLIKKHAVKLKKYPVSPFFTQKVMNLARTRQKEDVWVNLQIIPTPAVKFAFLTLLVIILFLFIPFNNYDNVQDTASPDPITILYNVDSLNYEIKSDDQALQFALVN